MEKGKEDDYVEFLWFGNHVKIKTEHVPTSLLAQVYFYTKFDMLLRGISERFSGDIYTATYTLVIIASLVMMFRNMSKNGTVGKGGDDLTR